MTAASLPARLARRAALYRDIRAYFAATGALEVTTPVLVRHATAEPTLANLALARDTAPRYLRTSPEAALKRLLADGAGDIYELGPVMRDDEAGRLHREEFTLLEWYRVGYDHWRLMADVAALLAACGWTRAPQRLAYADLFGAVLGADPHALSTDALCALARAHGVLVDTGSDRALLFDALYASVLEPALAARGAVLLHGFPVEQRAYARLAPTVPPVAERFELIVDGIELANGYHEIVDVDEQAACFAAENAVRAARGLPCATPDDDWLAALARGLPPCAGVALGVDRLLMVLAGARSLAAFETT